jgi:E3 ubiquitin-protein ligase UBR2
MLHIMQIVLERSINLRARSFSEAQLHKVLHLIGYALQEEEKQYCQFLLFTERAEKWGLERLIEELCSSARVESHKDLLAWTLGKYRQVAAPRRQGGPTSTVSSTLGQETSQSEDTAKEEKEWRAKMAAQKRAKIMAQMTAMQKTFMKENAKLFEATVFEVGKTGEFTGSSMDLSESEDTTPVALGPNQTTRLTLEQRYTCILCQEDQTVSADGPALVLAAFVQQSTVLCQRRKTESLDMEESGGDDLPDPLFLPATLGPAPHTGTCGHVMHSHCWQKYFDNVLAKENRRPYRLRQPASFDVEKHEFLCPLCECLNNTVLPLVPPLGALQPLQSSQPAQKNITFEAWLHGLQIALKYKKKLPSGVRNLEVRQTSPRIQALQAQENGSNSSSEQNQSDFQVGDGDGDSQPLQHLLYTCPLDQVSIELGDVGPDFAALFPTNRNLAEQPQLSDSLSDMVLLYSQATYTKGLGVHPHLGDSRVPLMTWKSCAYTIHSLECLLRDMEKPLFGDLSCRQQDCLASLVRIVGVLGTTWKRPEVISSHALRLLSMVLDNPSDGPCILDWDCFGVLVPLTLSLPSLFLSDQPTPIPSGNVQELNTLRLVFLSHIVKILLTTDFNEGEVPMDVEEEGGEEPAAESNLLELLSTVRKVAAVTSDENAVQLDAQRVWTQVRMKAETC